MPGHLIAPTVVVVGTAGLTAAALAFLAHRQQADAPPEEPAPPELSAIGTALLGAAASAISAGVSLQQIHSVANSRRRAWEERFSGDAADAVRAVRGDYVAGLKRDKLLSFLRDQPQEHARPGLDETQVLARLWCQYSIALRLTPEEGEEALQRASELLAEEYPSISPEAIRHECRKSHALAKSGSSSTLVDLGQFVQRVRPGGSYGPRSESWAGSG